MKRILVPTESSLDWQRLLAKPDLHWKEGYSAMAVAESWERAAPRLPPEIAKALEAAHAPELAGLELLLAIPEWEVPLPGGKTASHSDVLCLARNDSGLVVIAVEAKVDESFGPTCGEKRQEPSLGQKERLDYLHLVLALPEDAADGIRYQLLHRTVSAILTAQAFHAATAVMLVQSFSPTGCWKEDYQAFASAMGAAQDLEQAVPAPRHKQPRLYLGWCTGTPVRAPAAAKGALVS